MGEAKKKKWRWCPAAGREIAGQECGEGRHGRYACPAGCAFDPFASVNYSQVLEIEEEIDRKSFAALLRDDPGAVAAIQGKMGDALAMHAATVWRMFFHRDRAGRTFAECWTGEGELKNDQRVLWRHKAAMRASVFEVRRIFDVERFELVDLLEPARPAITVLDRSMGARVARFQAFVTWVYPLPHYWRVSGSGTEVIQFGPHGPEVVARETLRHLGAPEGAEQGRWLAESFARACGSLRATGSARRRQMLENIDARFGAATYDLKAPAAAVLAALAMEPDVDNDELAEAERREGFRSALVWFAGGERQAKARVPGRAVMGRVLMGERVARVEAVGGARLDELRARFEAKLGSRVKFAKERRDDFGRRMAAQMVDVERALVPPRLLEEPDAVELESSRLEAPPEGVSPEEFEVKVRQEMSRSWLEERPPALDGKTPRAAVSDPALRGRVVELVKRQVRELDRANLRTGATGDLGWLVRELGLVEIDLPVPPVRPRVSEDEEMEEAEPPDEQSVSAAELPRERALTVLEATERLDTALEGFHRAVDAMEELEALGVTVLEDIDELTRGELSEDEIGFLVPQVLQVWFALVPRGRAVQPRREAMAEMFRADFERLRQVRPGDAEAVTQLLRASRQPEFVTVMAAGVFEMASKLPKKQRPPSEPALLVMALALKALVEGLDRALRR